MKQCRKCLEMKPQGEFYAARRNRSGYSNTCKECSRELSRARNHTAEVRETYRLRELERSKDPAIREQRRARVNVCRAIKAGNINRDVCEHKGCSCTEGLNAHHYIGYIKDNELKVAFLCPICHSRIHNGDFDMCDVIIVEMIRRVS